MLKGSAIALVGDEGVVEVGPLVQVGGQNVFDGSPNVGELVAVVAQVFENAELAGSGNGLVKFFGYGIAIDEGREFGFGDAGVGRKDDAQTR